MKINGHVTRLINSLHVPGFDCDLFSCTRHGLKGKGFSFVLEDREMHSTFPKFTINDDIPINGDLRIRLNPLTDEDFEIPNSMCEETPLHYLNLDNFSTKLDMANKVLRGRVMTRAERYSQLNNLVELKQALGQSLEGPLIDNSSDNIILNEVRSNLQEGSYWRKTNHNSKHDCEDNFDLPLNATRDSSSDTNRNNLGLREDNLDLCDNATRDSSSENTNPGSFSGNCDDATQYSFFDLPDNYLCGGFPDKLMMEALKELNTNDIKDFLNHNNDDTSKQFEKQKRAPPPPYM